MTIPPGWRSVGVRLKFRNNDDGFVYAFLAVDDEEGGAIEVARFNRDMLDDDPALWDQAKVLLGTWLNRIVSRETGIRPDQLLAAEERPIDKQA